jgi:tetratricopeptide (TPR) repeat protein
MYRTALALTVILLMTRAVNGSMPAVQSATPDTLEERARAAMDRGDYIVAVPILLEALAQRPAADTYLNLGISYRHNRDWQDAENILQEGTDRFPKDPRIPTELANAYLGAGDIDSARTALHRALQIDPANVPASDLIANLELSEGEVQTALKFWNRSGYPVVNDVLHNSNITIGHWTVREGQAFHPGKMMTYSQWRTTQLRLLETSIFSNVGIDVEPAPASSAYNPIILTTKKSNSLANVAFDIVKGAPLQWSYLNWWDAANTGITLNSSYRWDYNRKRGEVQLHAPIPVPGILFLNATGLWRSERWDLAPVLHTDAGADDRFLYKSTGIRAEFKYIPYYRFDFGGGFEYTNRAANGGLPQLYTDSQNSGKVLFQASLRLADSRYQNRIHVEGQAARKNLLGDLNYSTMTAELNNEFLISKESDTVFDWTIRGGASKGQLPVEEYFVLGLDTYAGNLLRGHPAAEHGHYGNAPMGTSFMLSNMDLERRIAILPLFNTLNIPYLDVKGQVFLDSGKTSDRAHIFKEGTLYFDTGAGLKLETPTHSLNLIYAKSLRDGRNVFFAYIQKHW